jgi:uncharacterized protein (TIGR00369 family)
VDVPSDDFNAPPGFEILFPDEPFEMHAGPHYFLVEDGKRIAGMRARREHTSASGFVHGGALLAFADSALTACAMAAMDAGERVATISLTSEFMAPARTGDWIECRGTVTKLTRSLAFVRGEMTVDGEAVMTCSTVLRRWRPA